MSGFLCTDYVFGYYEHCAIFFLCIQKHPTCTKEIDSVNFTRRQSKSCTVRHFRQYNSKSNRSYYRKHRTVRELTLAGIKFIRSISCVLCVFLQNFKLNNWSTSISFLCTIPYKYGEIWWRKMPPNVRNGSIFFINIFCININEIWNTSLG